MTRPSGQNRPRRSGRHTRARTAARPSEGTEAGQALLKAGLPAAAARPSKSIIKADNGTLKAGLPAAAARPSKSIIKADNGTLEAGLPAAAARPSKGIKADNGTLEAGLPAAAPLAGEIPAGGPPDPAAAPQPPRDGRQQIRLTPQGMIEEDPALAGFEGRAGQDTRTIAELAASVMRSLSDAAAEPPQSATGAPQEEPDPADGDAVAASSPEEPNDSSRASRKSWAAAALAAVLLLVIGLAYCQSGLSTSGSGNGAGDAGGAAAIVTGGPASGDNSNAAIAAPTPTAPAPTEPAAPTPPPAVEIVEPPAPPPVAPAPVAPAPEPTRLHVHDLAPRVKPVGARVKVSVAVYVYDSAHNPVVGASVSGAWTGADGSTSCVTSSDSFCVFDTSPVSTPGQVTFVVTGVAYAGAVYDPAANHDVDGDSNGTSITVTF